MNRHSLSQGRGAENLFRYRPGGGKGRRRDRFRDPGRGDPGGGGRVGLRQERDRPLHHAAVPVPARTDRRGRDLVQRAGADGADRERDARHPRREIGMIFQEPMTSLNPVYHRRRPDRRGHPPAPESVAGRRPATAPSTMLGAGGHPLAGAALPRVPAPDERRHAPAGDDRHGPLLQPRACSSPTSRPPPWM